MIEELRFKDITVNIIGTQVNFTLHETTNKDFRLNTLPAKETIQDMTEFIDLHFNDISDYDVICVFFPDSRCIWELIRYTFRTRAWYGAGSMHWKGIQKFVDSLNKMEGVKGWI